MDIFKIKKALKDKHMTYANLSELTGIPIGTIKRLLSGVTVNPRIDTIEKIEEVLGFPSSDMVSPYLTEQEESLLRSYRNLSKENKALISTICKKIELSERR